jgi:hypothetical protein
MSITATIQCRACGNEEKTLDADAVWLAYPIPCAIEGGCQRCYKDELYLVRVGSKSAWADYESSNPRADLEAAFDLEEQALGNSFLRRVVHEQRERLSGEKPIDVEGVM